MYTTITLVAADQDPKTLDRDQGVTKRCRLSWLTDRALVYEPKCGGIGVCCGVSTNEYSCAHGAQINFGDFTPCLTYDLNVEIKQMWKTCCAIVLFHFWHQLRIPIPFTWRSLSHNFNININYQILKRT